MLPLSLSQREVWLDQRAWPDSAHLAIGGGVFLAGELDLARLQAALHRLIASQEALRLAPLAEGGQHLLADYRPTLRQDWLDETDDFASAAERIWRERTRQAFVLDGQQPPWRIELLSRTDGRHCLLLQFHHLVMDGWGTAQLIHLWADCYAALDAPPPSPAGDYLAFIADSQAYLDSPEGRVDAEFWQAQLPSLPAPLLERHYPPASGPDALPPALLAVLHQARPDYQRLLDFAAQQGQSEFCVFLSLLALYFARVQQLDEVVIGVPCLNRTGRRYRNTLGMFVGVMPLRITVDPQASVATLLASVSRALRQALRHARYPLSEVGRRLQAIRQNRDSLFDVLLSFEKQDYSAEFGAARTVGSRQFFTGTARYPLGVTVCEFAQDQDVELILEGSALCFHGGEVELLGRRLLHLLKQMLADPGQPLAALSHLPEEERWALLDGLYHDQPRHDAVQPFISLFEHQAALRPEAIALRWDGGLYDYAELQQRVRLLAAHLRSLGAGPERIIALCMRRSPEAVVALLAIARAGAAFLPLDVDAPDARLAGILQESGALAVLADAEARPRLAALHPLVLSGAEQGEPGQTDWPWPQPEQLAYVLFTSGSTGRPKGVMMEHGALARRLAWLSRSYAVTHADCAGQATQLTFDPALIELLLPLVHGGSVALPPPGRLAPEAVAAFTLRHGVSIMAFVPSTLQRFLDALQPGDESRLRVACCGGEVLTPALAARYLDQTRARLFNVYGPTEACIFATAWECERRGPDMALPVGRAVDDTRIYVLDSARQLLPFGCAGDIYIGGPGLARGYLHRPDLDAQAFCADPFLPGQRLYRTGDRGWLSSDGDLHFLGRSDRQVKLRGYRIELGEIEHALLGVAGVQQAICLLQDEGGKPALHAWVAAPGLRADSLQRHLRSRLPDYMLPSWICVLDLLPLNGTGKIDLAALPSHQPDSQARAGRAPVSELEKALLPLWQAALNRQTIGVEDSFFELGGDSLAAIDILSGIDQLTGKHSSLLMLTEHPSVAEMALALEANLGPAGILLPLSQHTQGQPLYLAASGHGDLLRFQNLARALGPSCALSMLQPPEAGRFHDMHELAELYANRIAATGQTRLALAGFSVGGIAALETARSLQARGIEVSSLILIDSVFPRSLWRRPRFWRLLGWLTRNLYVQELSMNGRRLGAMFGDTGLVSQVMALGGYRPSGWAGRTLLIKSSGLANWERALFRPWFQLMPGQLRSCEIDGLHGSIFETGHVGALAEVLQHELHTEEKQDG